VYGPSSHDGAPHTTLDEVSLAAAMISVGPQVGAGASPVEDEHANTVVKTTDVTIEVQIRATVSS